MIKKFFPLLALTVLFFLSNAIAEPLTLTENDANTIDHPIDVFKDQEITVVLYGDQDKSSIYSSGSGSVHMTSWKYEGSSHPDLLEEEKEKETSMVPTDPVFNQGNWEKCKISSTWVFLVLGTGSNVLTFKKYFTSNSTLSMNSPRLLKTIEFHLRLLDRTDEPMTSSRSDIQ